MPAPQASEIPEIPATALSGTSLSDAQTRVLARGLPVLNLVEALAALVLLVGYRASSVPSWQLLTWTAMVLGIVFLRVVAGQLLRQFDGDAASLRSWRLGLTACILANGALFGIAVVWFNPVAELLQPEHVTLQALILTLILGLTVVALTICSVHFIAGMLYPVVSLVPLAVHMALASPDYYPFTGGLLIFMVFGMLAARRIHSSSRDTLALQARNESLIAYLNRTRANAEALNEKLSQEICERKEARQRLQDSRDRLESTVRDRTRALEQINTELAATGQRLQLALDASNICLWDWNLVSGETFHSNFERLLGYQPEALGNFMEDLQRLVHTSDFPRIRTAMVDHFKGRSSQYQVIYRLQHADGQWHWIQDEGRVVAWNQQGRATRMIGTRRDITEDKEAREQLRLAATVFENASEAIFIFDPEFRFLTVNDCFTRITGYHEREVIGHAVGGVGNLPGNRPVYQTIVQALKSEGFWEGELLERRKTGEEYPEWLQISAVYDENGSLTHYVGMFSDLTARKEAEERVQFLSNFDRLTGFANRNQFRERLQKTLTLARLNRERTALVFLDLDRFRPINDSLGHEVGDRLLKLAAERLRGCGFAEENLARVGGDEFTLMVENYTNRAELEQVCQRLIGAMRRPFHFDQHELLLGASLGVSVFPDTAKDVQTLINQADLAMHQAKRAGGNTFQFYSSDMRVASVEQLALETSLRKAIFKNEFVVHYQPKMDLATDRITSVEALVRWQHPTMGLLPPKDFIPLAEETGLISAIGELVLERSCRQAVQWHRQGFADVCISVNLSAHQFRKGNVLEIVDRVLQTTELPAHLLELELTESLIMEDLDKNIALLQSLRKRGVELSLDDFGTGYSSLSYLKRFPIDTLKIDRSFITELDQSPDDAAITRAIIDMAHSLNLRVVAEGVETDSHLRILRSMGCDSIQGYLISKPVPEAELLQLLRAQQQARA
ncbi:putative bifunctional diguanylate cyclase/phosphodiesterase [Alcanivorax limicola]|uniref:putative bifunctional diguanylate cyclase/phosphodiesterase n=1 Tax=Alcanivorax limicola TaxID=2874102 RepID=UPI001CC15478|nr:GGDEF domain-containing phosphodiesterase [Alcanivorax limicola]